ncbi:SRPBCC family protein [Kribbella sp. NPDC056861]|uniref:SRPBCC family protein n=1 Tax=Kribbella sp. NPDC056861 TaxID=3154857 RepID=UPI00341C030E
MSTNPTTISAPAGTPFVSVTRDFDATPAQLFRVQTDPALVAQWLGPRGLEMTIDEYDVRPGGRYRYVHKDEHGEYAFRGVFHTVEPDTLVIQTFEWEGAPGEVCLERARYHRTDTGVRLHTESVFPSVEARDAAVQSGMEHGINDSMDRLAELLAKGES